MNPFSQFSLSVHRTPVAAYKLQVHTMRDAQLSVIGSLWALGTACPVASPYRNCQLRLQVAKTLVRLVRHPVCRGRYQLPRYLLGASAVSISLKSNTPNIAVLHARCCVLHRQSRSLEERGCEAVLHMMICSPIKVDIVDHYFFSSCEAAFARTCRQIFCFVGTQEL